MRLGFLAVLKGADVADVGGGERGSVIGAFVLQKSASSAGSICASSYKKSSKFAMAAALTATKEELLAVCVAEQSVRLSHQRLRMRWTNCLPVLGVEGLAGHIPWTEADPKLRGHFRSKTYTSCRPIADGHAALL